MKTIKQYFKILTPALIGLYGGITTYAATITSTSTGGLSNLNGTWVGNVQPSATDDVIIAAGATVSLGANTTWANLTVNGALVMQAKDLAIDDLSGSGT